MNDTHQELRDLITDVVTGSGHQLENLQMTDDEWAIAAEEQNPGDHTVTVTIPLEQWLEMIEVARNNTDIRPEPEEE